MTNVNFNHVVDETEWDAIDILKDRCIYHGFRINISRLSKEQISKLKNDLTSRGVKFEECKASTASSHVKAGDKTLRISDINSIANFRHNYLMQAIGKRPLFDGEDRSIIEPISPEGIKECDYQIFLSQFYKFNEQKAEIDKTIEKETQQKIEERQKENTFLKKALNKLKSCLGFSSEYFSYQQDQARQSEILDALVGKPDIDGGNIWEAVYCKDNTGSITRPIGLIYKTYQMNISDKTRKEIDEIKDTLQKAHVFTFETTAGKKGNTNPDTNEVVIQRITPEQKSIQTIEYRQETASHIKTGNVIEEGDKVLRVFDPISVQFLREALWRNNEQCLLAMDIDLIPMTTRQYQDMMTIGGIYFERTSIQQFLSNAQPAPYHFPVKKVSIYSKNFSKTGLENQFTKA